MKNFFISYTKADQSWAEWIAWQLENEGYTTVIQAWDFHAGSNFVSNMQNVAIHTECTIAVISPAFFTSPYTEAEWTSAFSNDPTGSERKLIMVRVEEVKPPGLLKPRVYIDLVGLNAKDASELLLRQIKGKRARPENPPFFPGADNSIEYPTVRFPGELPSIWNISVLRNPNFTGRDEYLSEMENAFKSGIPAALTQIVSGLGGIGKTQIVLEYAYRYSTNYQAIWWIRSEDEKTIAADYAAFASKANLPEKDIQEEHVIINAVRDWLEHNQNWLLIFDNAIKPEDVCKYLPRGKSGHVLITSRRKAWEKIGKTLSIDIWPRQESVDFLIKRTKDKVRSNADRVANALGDLPLALEQAAAFINETGIGFDDYLKLYRTRRNELWEEENPPLGYPDTVETTWSLAIEKVKEEAPVGALVLNLCSYFAPDEIPRSLISDASKYLPDKSSILISDSLALYKGIRALNQYSLVTARPESLSIHHLVQVVVRDYLTTEEKKIWSQAAIQTVNSIFPSKGYYDPGVWPKCASLLSHGQFAIKHAAELETALEPIAMLFNNIGLYLFGRASYIDAESLFRRALEIRETQLGADHIDVAQSLNNLAGLLQNRGKYTDAEPLFRRALGIRETQLGVDHPDVAQSLNNLAGLLRVQGKYTDAEPLFRRALEIRETQLGVDHPDVAQSLNNLAGLLRVQGKYTDAEPLFRRALEIREMQLGVDHPDVATSLNNLAKLQQNLGKYTDAELLFRRALEIREKQLGVDHPRVATSLNNLAGLLRVQGKYIDAEPLFRRALEIRETLLGVDHPETNTVRDNLENLLSDISSK